MDNPNIEAAQSRSLVKGLIAGLVGGLVGVIAMTLAERMIPHHGRNNADIPETERSSALSEGSYAPDGLHWGVGAALGAAYGAVAEFYPSATAKEGATFGMALEALTRHGAFPAVGLLSHSNASEEDGGEITSHMAYGIATEVVRGFVRKRL